MIDPTNLTYQEHEALREKIGDERFFSLVEIAVRFFPFYTRTMGLLHVHQSLNPEPIGAAAFEVIPPEEADEDEDLYIVEEVDNPMGYCSSEDYQAISKAHEDLTGVMPDFEPHYRAIDMLLWYILPVSIIHNNKMYHKHKSSNGAVNYLHYSDMDTLFEFKDLTKEEIETLLDEEKLSKMIADDTLKDIGTECVGSESDLLWMLYAKGYARDIGLEIDSLIEETNSIDLHNSDDMLE